MSATIARYISIILNPIFILLFLPLLLVYRATGSSTLAVEWTLYTAFFLFIFGAGLWYGVQKKIFTDLDVSKREQRPLLFTWTVIFTILYLAGLFLFHAPQILFLVVFAVIFGIFIASLLNRYLKVSLHVAGITSLAVALAITYRGWFYLLLLFVPLVAWARIRIKRHTPQETVAGAILGSLLSLGMYVIVRVFFYH
jgi:membrane-associated phospholipid phosphatase